MLGPVPLRLSVLTQRQLLHALQRHYRRAEALPHGSMRIPSSLYMRESPTFPFSPIVVVKRVQRRRTPPLHTHMWNLVILAFLHLPPLLHPKLDPEADAHWYQPVAHEPRLHPNMSDQARCFRQPFSRALATLLAQRDAGAVPGAYRER